MAQTEPQAGPGHDLGDDIGTSSSASTDSEDISLRAVDRAAEKYSSMEHERRAARMSRAISRGQES